MNKFLSFAGRQRPVILFLGALVHAQDPAIGGHEGAPRFTADGAPDHIPLGAGPTAHFGV